MKILKLSDKYSLAQKVERFYNLTKTARAYLTLYNKTGTLSYLKSAKSSLLQAESVKKGLQ
jgi:hypothetical protein